MHSRSTASVALALTRWLSAGQTPMQQALDRFARLYTPVVLAGAVIVAVVPPLAEGQPWSTWVYRGLSVLVLACPCAIVMAAPLPAMLAIAASANAGVLFKSGQALETLGRVGVVGGGPSASQPSTWVITRTSERCTCERGACSFGP